VKIWIPYNSLQPSKVLVSLIHGQVLTADTRNEKPIDTQQIAELATKIGAKGYIECSALTGSNVAELFEKAREASASQPIFLHTSVSTLLNIPNSQSQAAREKTQLRHCMKFDWGSVASTLLGLNDRRTQGVSYRIWVCSGLRLQCTYGGIDTIGDDCITYSHLTLYVHSA
jgi:hypothetical protein